LTGLIVTKTRRSGKGGVVVAIQDELGIPTRFVGTGEKLEDFKEFNGRDFHRQHDLSSAATHSVIPSGAGTSTLGHALSDNREILGRMRGSG